MQDVLDRIRERVDNLQKNLSEEDLKNAKVEALRFDRVSRALSRLTQALQQKNGEDALAAAKDVLEQLRVMERQLNRASESLSSYGSETEAALTEEQESTQKIDPSTGGSARSHIGYGRKISFLPGWKNRAPWPGTRVLCRTELAETARRTALVSPAISQQHIDRR
jgi:hypothetical protein